jgi:hypothetical protein
MDFIVNESMYVDQEFVAHLKKNKLDLFKGVQDSYKFKPRTKNDDELRNNILRWNDVCIYRANDEAKFNAVKGPVWQYITDYCSEYLNSNFRRWDADTYYEFTTRTIEGTADRMQV